MSRGKQGEPAWKFRIKKKKLTTRHNNGSNFLHKMDVFQMNLTPVVVTHLHKCYISEVIQSFLGVTIKSHNNWAIHLNN